MTHPWRVWPPQCSNIWQASIVLASHQQTIAQHRVHDWSNFREQATPIHPAHVIELTITCLLCLSIHWVSWFRIRRTASYHRGKACSTPEGGQAPRPPSARGARMLDNMLHKAWCNSVFFLAGVRSNGFAFTTNDVDALSPPNVVTWDKSQL